MDPKHHWNPIGNHIWYWSYQESYSRAFIDFLLNDLNTTEFLQRVKHAKMPTEYFPNDAVILSTLNSADAVDAPGGFTQQCMRKGHNLGAITK